MRTSRLTALTLLVLALPAAAAAQTGESTINSNFNGTAIPAGSDLWFNAVFKLSPSSTSGTVQFVNSSIQFTSGGTTYNVAVPNATISFSSATSLATTSFDGASSTWMTSAPLQSALSGNVFLSGVNLHLPAGLSGGTNPVTWTGQFLSDTPGLSVNWKWGAAVYTSFSSDLNALHVKPVDDNSASAYANSDHAGTPEAYKAFVTGGARGGGGSNWTGSYSGTASVDVASAPSPVVPEPPTLLLLASGLGLVGLLALRRLA